ncbi:VirB4 family type IV secretion/conjugal transfer ATPase [Kingella kingae]|uniref:VirB4 family type IV secretion/conjugal transfer ATPase n=1 Tax=Kingella kingae TaxID=504 RepID=UPI0025519C75|nr:VirB4 family type IV secretion/conjugal transfer ATPase [Kingella kingae]MDK4564921.1 VirB4 family type IV secretion/conjugal transfer ATPase [Kingella kingae]
MYNPKKYNEFLQNEKTTSDNIPYMSLEKNCVSTANAELIRTYHISGRFYETADNETLNTRNNQMNNFLRSITSSQVAIYVHRIRADDSIEINADFGSKFGNEFAEKYNKLLNNRKLKRTDLFVSVVYRMYPNRAAFLSARAAKRNIEAIRQDRAAALEKLDEICQKLEAGLSRYYPSLLKSVWKDGVEYNEQLTFFNYLLTFDWKPVRVLRTGNGVPVLIKEYLANCRLSAGEQTMAVETAGITRYAQAIEFKEYNSFTEMGMLDDLLYPQDVLPYRFIETQSFAFKTKPDAKKYLQTQRNQLIASEDGAVEQIAAMDEAINDLIDGRFSIGEYHYSLLVIGDSKDEVKANTLDAVSQLQNIGFVPVISRAANVGAFYAQLPANFKYRPRIANLSSVNFSMLAPLNNIPRGKDVGNPWGSAVIPFLSPSNQLTFFNFHDSPDNTDNYDDKLLGNSMIIGKSSSGKTTFLCAMMSMLQQFRLDKNGNPTPFNCVYFDKDMGAKIAILAMGGSYLALETGKPTGFNPFQMEKNADNVVFLNNLLILLLEQESNNRVTTADKRKLALAIDIVMDMPKPMRRLSTVLQNITDGVTAEQRENSISQRLSQWVGNGLYAWVFDQSDNDLLDFESKPIFGIDGTAFLDDKQARAPIAMYLLYRMNKLMDGRRFFYFMDEFWKWLEDPVFSDFCKDKQLTIRKLNGFGVFATQQPDIILSNPNASALFGQMATLILMPNPSAKYDEYVKGFGLSEAEYLVVKNLNEDSRSFLVKQTGVGENGDNRSYIASFNLNMNETDEQGNTHSVFKNIIRVLSGSADKIPLCDRAIEELGDNPDDWLPYYLELVENGKRFT